MPNKSVTMKTLRMIIRLYCYGTAVKAMASMVRTSRNTIKKYLRIWNTLGISYEEFCDKSDEELARLFSINLSPLRPNSRMDEMERLLPEICKKLKRRGVTTLMLHDEYMADHPDGYSISQFRGHIRRHLQLSKAVMHIEHKAGDKMYVDYAGDKLHLTLADGTRQQVEVFVAILGCSQLTYVEATKSQRKEDFIGSCENALHFFGGAPLALVTDNLKSAVTKASRYEAVLNEDFAAFGEHYGVALCPARGYRPKDKALVENAVKLTYRHIYTRLEGQTFSDLHSLNLALRSALEIYNNKEFSSKSYSRRDHFEDVEKDVLRPLNPIRFELLTHLVVTVNRYAHVRLKEDIHYYSVPHIHIGKKVKLSYNNDSVAVYLEHELITFHKRDRTPHGYTTEAEHQPARHRFVIEWSPENFLAQARAIDEDVEHYVAKVLESRSHPEQAYKCCAGIMTLARKVGNERIASACRFATSLDSYGYTVLENILNRRLDQLEVREEEPDEDEMPEHDNIRGKEYYK
jgi:transposase